LVFSLRANRATLVKIQDLDSDVGFEVLTAVVMKSSVFWDITPCSPLKVKPDVLQDNVPSTFRIEE
jgi:hypothetical protein